MAYLVELNDVYYRQAFPMHSVELLHQAEEPLVGQVVVVEYLELIEALTQHWFLKQALLARILLLR